MSHAATRRHLRTKVKPLLLASAALALSVQGCAHKACPPLAVAPQNIAAPQEPAKPATPQPIIEAAALERLKQMSDLLAAAKSFSYHARSTVEKPYKTGQFVTLLAESYLALERPNKLRSVVKGDVPHFEYYYDGSTASAFDPEKNLYAEVKAPASIDEMLPFIQEKAGIDFPSADLLFSKPYDEMTRGLTQAAFVGRTQINGVACDHYAFVSPSANWEIWIESGANPLPRRVAATYTAADNLPRFQIEFSNWNLHAKSNAAQFNFKKPANARQIEFGGKPQQ